MLPKVKFSSHALKRMKERFISRYIVISALQNPDYVKNSIKVMSRFLIKKLYFNKRFKKKHLLMIIFEQDKNAMKVITIIDTSKINKYLNI